ncbi:MAG: helix-turn-helix transcriptional regulator [Thiomonas sp.]
MAVNLDAQTFLRRIDILQRLPAHGSGRITARDLVTQLQAAGYAVEKRTIERDLEFLRDGSAWLGQVVCDDRSKPYGWSIVRNSQRRAIAGLSVDEALALAWIDRYGQGLLPQGMVQTLQPFFREAQERLRHDQRAQAWLAHKVRVINARPVAPPPAASPAVLRVVTQALYEDVQLQLDYRNAQGAQSRMTVSPLALVSRDLNLYLVAWIARFANLRVLQVSRIRGVKVLNVAAERPVEFDIDAYLATGVFQLGGEEERVRLRFTAFAGQPLLDAPMGRAQEVHAQGEDGLLELSAIVRVSPQFKAWLLGYGAAVTVIEPQTLRQDIAQEVQRMWGGYRG